MSQACEVDWSMPIEAYHTDGRVMPVERIESWGEHCIRPDLEGGWFAFQKDGSHLLDSCKWTIRNVATPPADARTAPNGGEVGPEVVERMIALVRRIDTEGDAADQFAIGWICEAIQIVALLPDPIDAATAFAEQVFRGISDGGPFTDDAVKSLMREAFEAGRALEKEAGR